MADITEGTVFGLGISQTIDLGGYGLASVSASGTPKVNARLVAGGIAAASAAGMPSVVALLRPVAIDASGAGLGSPSLAMVMAPTGVASGEAFGDADTLATVFIIPGPFDPSNDFGDAVATKRGWLFRTPVNTYQWRLFKEYEGISLLREGGVWSEVAHPDLERTRAAEKYLAGGRDHVVSTSLKAELEGLGYTVTEDVVTTEEYL